MATAPASPAVSRPPGRVRGFAIRRPVLAFCLFAVGLSVSLIAALLIAEVSVIPGKAAQLVIVPGTAVLITAWISGRAGVRWLFAGLLRWRIGITRWLLVLLALPLLTVAVAAVTGTLQHPPTGWINITTAYLLTLVLVLITANLWEEMAWTGFVQTRLTARHGLLRGALLTAIPVFVIHLPLSYETNGLYGTRWEDAALNWGLLLVALPAFRYLAGVLMLDTQGSVLAVGVLHASFNASGGMDIIHGGWQYVPAVVLLALGVATHRAIQGRRHSQPVTATPAAEAGAAAPDQSASQNQS
jgi:membrane protease YdiL (CAAX protease family)